MHFHNPINRRRRHGFLLIEILIAFAFLAVMAGIVLNIHQARLDYDRNSMNRLREQLRIENLAEQFASIPYETLAESAAQLAIQSGVELDTDSFQLDSRSGIHLVLRTTSQTGPLEHHYWRLEPIQ